MFLQYLPAMARQTALYAAALAAAKLMSFVMVPVYTAWLAPADYARLDVLQTMANLLTMLVGMGMNDTLFRFGGSADSLAEKRRVGADILGLILISCALFQGLLQLLAPVITALLPGDIDIMETRLMLGAIGFTGTVMVPLAWCRLQGRAFAYFLSYTSWMALMAVLSTLFLVAGYGVRGVMWSIFLAHLVMSVCLVTLQLRDSGVRFDIRGWKPYWRFGAPLILAGLAGFALGSFDRWILAAQDMPVTLAEYVLAAKIASLVALMAEPFDLWWLPRRFQMLRQQDGKKQVAGIITMGLVLVMLTTIFMAAAGPVVITLLTPADYHGAIRYMPWLGLLVALQTAARLLNMGCHAGDSTMGLFRIDFLAAGIVVIAYVLLIPSFAAWGAILATAIALSLRLALIIRASQRQLPLPFDWWRIVILGVMTIASVMIIVSLSGIWTGVIMALVSLALVSGLAWGLGLVPVPDRIFPLQGLMK